MNELPLKIVSYWLAQLLKRDNWNQTCSTKKRNKMKNSAQLIAFKSFFILLVFNLIQLIVLAQDSTSSSSTTSTSVTTEQTTEWYSSPWVWVIGAAVFILLLVALLRGNSGRTTTGGSDKVTVTKTVRRDTDTDVQNTCLVIVQAAFMRLFCFYQSSYCVQ